MEKHVSASGIQHGCENENTVKEKEDKKRLFFCRYTKALYFEYLMSFVAVGYETNGWMDGWWCSYCVNRVKTLSKWNCKSEHVQRSRRKGKVENLSIQQPNVCACIVCTKKRTELCIRKQRRRNNIIQHINYNKKKIEALVSTKLNHTKLLFLFFLLFLHLTFHCLVTYKKFTLERMLSWNSKREGEWKFSHTQNTHTHKPSQYSRWKPSVAIHNITELEFQFSINIILGFMWWYTYILLILQRKH